MLAGNRGDLGARTLAEALTWCLAWVVGTTGEFGIGAFAWAADGIAWNPRWPGS
jgi:hypothetical protein